MPPDILARRKLKAVKRVTMLRLLEATFEGMRPRLVVLVVVAVAVTSKASTNSYLILFKQARR